MARDPVEIDLARHEREQERAEAAYEHWHQHVIDDLVDRLLEGRAIRIPGIIGDLSILDFLDGSVDNATEPYDHEDVANLLCGTEEQQLNTRYRLLKVMEERIRRWCEESRLAQDWIQERCYEMER